MRQAVAKRQIEVCIGSGGARLGTLVYVKHGRREYSMFAYDEEWLSRDDRFAASPDLDLINGYQTHKALAEGESPFHAAISDTTPDAWGRRLIARDHAKRRATDRSRAPLQEIDYLLAVDDFSRTGALRFRDGERSYLRTVEEGRRHTPPLVELQKIYETSRAVEKGEESTADLRYLLGKGTSLGGMRPKCTIIDDQGFLAIGKFPSVNDSRSVTRGEVLALTLAQQAGINSASARIVEIDGTPIAVIRRFDRDAKDGRIPYLSAASLLNATGEQERSYTEIADALRARGEDPTRDTRELWRRMLFNLLITNVDDHLHNHAVLHVDRGLWRLAPAFDLNPFPDKERESKTWLSEEDGPIVSVQGLLSRAEYFGLGAEAALGVLGQVWTVVTKWREIAQSSEVGLGRKELEEFAPAFEHDQMEAARRILSKSIGSS